MVAMDIQKIVISHPIQPPTNSQYSFLLFLRRLILDFLIYTYIYLFYQKKKPEDIIFAFRLTRSP